MSRIRHCPNPECPNFHHHTAAHGTVRRVRCKSCGHTASTRTYSIHYFAKRRPPLESIFVRLRSGTHAIKRITHPGEGFGGTSNGEVWCFVNRTVLPVRGTSVACIFIGKHAIAYERIICDYRWIRIDVQATGAYIESNRSMQ